jgi:hypothetical protein
MDKPHNEIVFAAPTKLRGLPAETGNLQALTEIYKILGKNNPLPQVSVSIYYLITGS